LYIKTENNLPRESDFEKRNQNMSHSSKLSSFFSGLKTLKTRGCQLQVAGCGLRVAGCGLRVAGSSN